MDLGPLEILLILAVVAMIFGVGKLPEVGSALGKGIREFRAATHEEDVAPKPDAAPSEPAQPESRNCPVCGAPNEATCSVLHELRATNVGCCRDRGIEGRAAVEAGER